LGFGSAPQARLDETRRKRIHTHTTLLRIGAPVRWLECEPFEILGKSDSWDVSGQQGKGPLECLCPGRRLTIMSKPKSKIIYDPIHSCFFPGLGALSRTWL
jgi:hypothetical protein